MLSSSLRTRLSRIARGGGDTPGLTVPAVAASPLAERADAAGVPWCVDYEPLTCGREIATPMGTAWEVLVPLDARAEDRAVPMGPADFQAEKAALCVDIECAGLSGAPLFLIGTLRVGPQGRELRQLLARDYSEEAAVLVAFHQAAGEVPRWITFNGASFDLPYLRDRCAYHRIHATVPPLHTDVLPLARRLWRGMTANCRLVTLEREVCGRRRLGDVHGHAIPPLYHEFVRTGRWEILTPVLQHNALDLLTTADLWRRAGHAGRPAWATVR